MGHLEEIARGSGRLRRSSASSGTATTGSDGGVGAESPPWSLDLRCRPMEEVVTETRLKGPLIDRLHRLEDRVLKMGEEMEAEMEMERKKEERRSHRKGLKSLVKSCMRGKTGEHHKDVADE
ncbi:unnamed protein product [Spirodela intermedia]|uniref:Uncharacterized protein n=2 Tax=Spirodela intermedia TaxID=51605 RepID=A0A7I8IYD0_SPIIN|nr:unnamed protein product [Spirodela intermedia]CAA6662887.1 unnamed protein product [Spirodela intermedia]CAA7399300.1 unnamed protein product [Spirodela intermedia]